MSKINDILNNLNEGTQVLNFERNTIVRVWGKKDVKQNQGDPVMYIEVDRKGFDKVTIEIPDMPDAEALIEAIQKCIQETWG